MNAPSVSTNSGRGSGNRIHKMAPASVQSISESRNWAPMVEVFGTGNTHSPMRSGDVLSAGSDAYAAAIPNRQAPNTTTQGCGTSRDIAGAGSATSATPPSTNTPSQNVP